MSKIKTILIDDEPDAISSLLYELNEFPEIEVISSFTDVSLAEQFILKNSPQLIFLDIHMPMLTGIEFLKKYPRKTFEVIFTTAHVKHAYEAYKNEIIDYLLKPVSQTDLRIAINKYFKKVQEKKQLIEFERIKTNKIIAVNLGNKERIVNYNEIIYCAAEGNYTHLFLTTGERLFITHKIKYFDEHLGNRFFRIHKSYLVNLEQIHFFDKKKNLIHLKSLNPLPLSRLKRKEFISLLNK